MSNKPLDDKEIDIFLKLHSNGLLADCIDVYERKDDGSVELDTSYDMDEIAATIRYLRDTRDAYRHLVTPALAFVEMCLDSIAARKHIEVAMAEDGETPVEDLRAELDIEEKGGDSDE